MLPTTVIESNTKIKRTIYQLLLVTNWEKLYFQVEMIDHQQDANEIR
jgi:hypothetical protein